MIDFDGSLPESWSWTTVGDLVIDALPGFASGEKVVPNGVRHLRMNNIGSEGKLNLELVRTVPSQLASARHLLQSGDVLFCQTNSPKLVGKTALFNLDGPYAYSNHLCRLRPNRDLVEPSWLAHWLQRLWQTGYFAERCKAWVNQATIERAILLATPIPLPSLAIQHEIVATLDKTLARLDAVRARLSRLPEILKRYRASILKAACEGRLVPTEAELARVEGRAYEPAGQLLARILEERRARWEAAELAKFQKAGKTLPMAWQQKYKQPEPPDTSELPELPEGWRWATVAQIAASVRYGSSAKTSDDAEGVPVLRMGNIQDGSLHLSSLRYLPKHHPEFPDLLLMPGDLLFNRTNSPELVGKSAVYHGSPEPCSYASYLIGVRLATGCLPDHLNYFLNSVHGRKWVAAVVNQQVGQANVNGIKLQELAFPLPPQAEQHRIVAAVDRQLRFVDRLEATVATNLKRVEGMREGVLARAFRGELSKQVTGVE
ncbi:MAG: restriction endonuclease subunit S [Dehalococcoidia bacterium]